MIMMMMMVVVVGVVVTVLVVVLVNIRRIRLNSKHISCSLHPLRYVPQVRG